MYQHYVRQRLITEKVKYLSLWFRQIIVVEVEGRLQPRRDHLDRNGVAENAFFSILKQQRLFVFLTLGLGHLDKEGVKDIVLDLLPVDSILHEFLCLRLIKGLDISRQPCMDCFESRGQFLVDESFLTDHHNWRQLLQLFRRLCHTSLFFEKMCIFYLN